MTSDPTMFVIGSATAAILLFGSFRYAMTANARRVRFWGHRIATSSLFVAGGALVALAVLKPELVGRSGYFWAAAMFIAAGLLSIPIRKFKITSAADPLADLSRLPTRLDP
jgi:hypothetical protein